MNEPSLVAVPLVLLWVLAVAQSVAELSWARSHLETTLNPEVKGSEGIDGHGENEELYVKWITNTHIVYRHTQQAQIEKEETDTHKFDKWRDSGENCSGRDRRWYKQMDECRGRRRRNIFKWGRARTHTHTHSHTHAYIWKNESFPASSVFGE